jgi:hypothetical protein
LRKSCDFASSLIYSVINFQFEGQDVRKFSPKAVAPTVTIYVSGCLSKGHLTYLDQLVASAIQCGLWPLLNLTNLAELDRVALVYLMGGEGRDFGMVACPNFVREWMQHESAYRAA